MWYRRLHEHMITPAVTVYDYKLENVCVWKYTKPFYRIEDMVWIYLILLSRLVP